MELGQLPAQTDGALAPESRGKIRQGVQQLMGGVIENHGACFVLQAVQVLPAAFFRRGQEAFKTESAGGLAGNAQGGNGGAGAGNGAYGNARRGALLHQVLAGVGNGGRPRVGYQGAGFSCQDSVQYFFALEGLVVLVVAHQGLFQLQVVQ